MPRIFSSALLLLYTFNLLSIYTPQLSLMLNFEQVMKEYCIYNDILLEKCDGKCYEKHIHALTSKSNPGKNHKVPGKNTPVPAHLITEFLALGLNCNFQSPYSKFIVNRLPGLHSSKISPPPETGII